MIAGEKKERAANTHTHTHTNTHRQTDIQCIDIELPWSCDGTQEMKKASGEEGRRPARGALGEMPEHWRCQWMAVVDRPRG